MADITLMQNPMDDAGQIIYGGASGVPTKLAVGTDDQVLTLASGVPTWADAAGGSSIKKVRLYDSTSSQSIAASGFGAALTFDSERVDSDGFHEGVTNPSRITIPADGWYSVGGTVTMPSGTSGRRWKLILKVDGATVIAQQAINFNTSFGLDVTVNTEWQFTAAQYVELWVYNGEASTAKAATGYEFWATYLGA